MIERFNSEQIRREALTTQQIVGGDAALAAEIDKRGELVEFKAGTAFIEQDGDVYLILAGVCDVVINGRVIAKRGRAHR